MEDIRSIRALKIYDILSMNTDEEHPLTTAEIVEELQKCGISSTRKSIKLNIDMLNSIGYEVMCDKKNKCYYYVADRKFNVPELKILIDAVQCANFITESKSKEFIKKLSNTAGTYKGELLAHNVLYDNDYKKTNEQIFYSVNNIESAIQNGKKISFKYFDNLITGEKKYRKDGDLYVINPVKLTINNNNYYLICYSDKHLNLTSYRVDRMEQVLELEEDKLFADCEKDENIDKYLVGLFDMFGGEKEQVTMRCVNSPKYAEIINDQFGTNKRVINIKEDYFDIRVDVGISNTFFAWLSTFKGDIKITFPKKVIEGYEEFLKSNLESLS